MKSSDRLQTIVFLVLLCTCKPVADFSSVEPVIGNFSFGWHFHELGPTTTVSCVGEFRFPCDNRQCVVDTGDAHVIDWGARTFYQLAPTVGPDYFPARVVGNTYLKEDQLLYRTLVPDPTSTVKWTTDSLLIAVPSANDHRLFCRRPRGLDVFESHVPFPNDVNCGEAPKKWDRKLSYWMVAEGTLVLVETDDARLLVIPRAFEPRKRGVPDHFVEACYNECHSPKSFYGCDTPPRPKWEDVKSYRVSTEVLVLLSGLKPSLFHIPTDEAELTLHFVCPKTLFAYLNHL